MAYGNAVTSGTLRATGTVGYIVAFDLSALELDGVAQVQANISTDFSDIATEESTWEALAGYLNSSDAPDVAFNLDGNTLNVFVNATTYVYGGTTYVAAWFYRSPENVTATTDYLDIPQSDRKLFTLLALQQTAILKGKIPSRDVEYKITQEREALGI